MDDDRSEIPLTETHSHSDCGCNETDVAGPVFDVRGVPHAIRHAAVFGAWSTVSPGGSLVLIAPHNPKPLLAQLADRYGPVTVTYLDEQPDAWRLQLTRA